MKKLIIMFSLIPCMSFAFGWNLGSYFKVGGVVYTSSVDSGTFQASNALHAAAEAGLTNYALSIAGGLAYQSNVVIAANSTNAAQQDGINATSNGVLAVSNQMVLSTQAIVGGLGYVSNLVIAAALTNAGQEVGIAANSNAIIAAATTNAEQQAGIAAASNGVIVVSNQMAGTTQALVGGLANVSNLAVWASNNAGGSASAWSTFTGTGLVTLSVNTNPVIVTGGTFIDGTYDYGGGTQYGHDYYFKSGDPTWYLFYDDSPPGLKKWVFYTTIQAMNGGEDCWINNESTNTPAGTYTAAGTNTGSPVVTYAVPWRIGVTNASGDRLSIKRHGVDQVVFYQGSNVFPQPIYGPSGLVSPQSELVTVSNIAAAAAVTNAGQEVGIAAVSNKLVSITNQNGRLYDSTGYSPGAFVWRNKEADTYDISGGASVWGTNWNANAWGMFTNLNGVIPTNAVSARVRIMALATNIGDAVLFRLSTVTNVTSQTISFRSFEAAQYTELYTDLPCNGVNNYLIRIGLTFSDIRLLVLGWQY